MALRSVLQPRIWGRGASPGTGWRLGVTARLVVLVMLPLIVLTLVSAPLALQARENAARASAADRVVPSLTATVAALTAVVAEHGVAEADVMAMQTRIAAASVNAALGFVVASNLDGAEAASDRTLSALAPSLARRLRLDLAIVRGDLRAVGGVTSEVISARYEAIEAVLEHAASVPLAALGSEMLAISGSTTASRSLLALGWGYRLIEAQGAVARDITPALFGAAAARRAAQLRLAQDDALFAEASEQIMQSGVPRLAASWSALSRSQAAAARNTLLSEITDGRNLPVFHGRIDQSPSTISMATLAGSIRGLSPQFVSDLIAQASTAVRRSTDALAAGNTRAYRLWLVLVGLAALLALAVAVRIAQSIARPLGRLAAAARSVVEGHLDIEPLGTRGPTETAIVADAFDSLVSNLRLLEAKANALATCDFDSEIVSVPLPGRLGASLQDSVRVLAGSIEDRDALQERLAHQATHDSLTALPNRAAAITALEHALARARRRAEMTAVLTIDLDNFTQTNDLNGHHTGDQILRQAADHLTAAVREGDMLARFGGDEFLVIAERVQGQNDAEALAARLLDALAEPVDCDTVRFSLRACIGIALADANNPDALQLLAQSDLALYHAKQHGTGRIELYDRTLQQRLAEREEIERELRQELARGGGGLVLFYQPLVDTSKTLRGVEALIRWERPGQGLLAPDRFVPIAEASELIIELDSWVLATAARQMKAWSTDPHLADLKVSVNISARHVLSRQLPDHLRAVLADTGIDPCQLTIELTETMLIDDLSIVAAELAAVRQLGARIAVDDFGTGYTSLAHLQHLPIDTVKIDRSFITSIDIAKDASLIRMITELAHELGLSTVSEGVETDEQFITLQDLGADQIQGYLIARPMPPNALRQWTTHPTVHPATSCRSTPD